MFLFFIGTKVDISIPDPITSTGFDLKCAFALKVSALGKSVANTFLTTVQAVVCFCSIISIWWCNFEIR